MAAEAPLQLGESSQLEESMPATQAPATEVQSNTEAAEDSATTQVLAVNTLVAPDPDTNSSAEVPMQLEESMPATEIQASEAEVPMQLEESMPAIAIQASEMQSSTATPAAQEFVVPLAAFVKPDKPKKYVSAWWIYSCCVRDQVGRDLREKGENPRLGDIAKVVGQRWKELPEAERKVYEDKAVVDKQRYETEMEVYTAACDPVASLRHKYKHLIPQRPLSAQALFNQDVKQREKALEALQVGGQECGNRDVSSKLSEMWKEASAEERISYEEKHTRLQLEYLELLRPWQASPEYKEIEQAEKAQQQVKQVVELATKAAETRRQEEERAAKKRARGANQKAVETPPKRARGPQQGTPSPAAKKSGKGQEVSSVRIEDKVLKEASKLGLAVALENLVGRPEVVSSRKSARAVLDALKASGGLVNPAKRSLLGL